MHAKKLLAFIIATLTAAPALAVKEHDNKVYFDGPALQAVSFQQAASNGYSITRNQPFSGVSASIEKGQIMLNVRAGRKKSGEVSSWFKSVIGGGQTLACDSSGTYPKELNFAVRGDLNFTMNNRKITCKDMVIGQGSFGENNNWWVSSPSMTGIHISISGATALSCSAEGAYLPVVVAFTPKTPCVSHFNIAPLN
ncbi:hypothetical protein IB234_13460 [Pseudomonas sp. PDM16]|uniref:hypothetical protein n=1 Tax=Pseudomonas sp. PDM16 TaxID=2769292 RepID=UPI00177EE93D|nr:hypothetical protein [Pseudomonas sp. PDM16]MBD9415564.1 hypothetical protein [Pseudomonas sp. PDM16]